MLISSLIISENIFTAVTNHLTLRGKDGKYFVVKGSTICPVLKGNHGDAAAKLRSEAKIHKEVLTEDYEVNSVSTAGMFVLGAACNGWMEWKTKSGDPVDVFRK